MQRRVDKQKRRRALERSLSIMLSLSMILSMFPSQGVAEARDQLLDSLGVAQEVTEEVTTQEEQPLSASDLVDDQGAAQEDEGEPPQQEVATTEEAAPAPQVEAAPVVEEAAPAEAEPASEPEAVVEEAAPAEQQQEAPAPEEKRVPTSDNLRDFAKSVKIVDTPQASGAYQVNEGENYIVEALFAEKANKQFADDEVLVYALPEGFVLADEQPVLDDHVTVSYYDSASQAEDHRTRFTIEAEDWWVEDGALHVLWKEYVDDSDEIRDDFKRLANLTNAEVELDLVGSFVAGTSSLEFGNDEHHVRISLNVKSADAQAAGEEGTTEESTTEETTQPSTEQPADEQTADQKQERATEESIPEPERESQGAGNEAYTLNVQFVDANYKAIAKNQIQGINTGSIQVRLYDRERNQTIMVPVNLTDAGNFTTNITDFNRAQYVDGDTVTSTLIYGGTAYASGASIADYEVLVTDDKAAAMTTIVFKQHRKPVVTVNFLDENDEYVSSTGFSDQYKIVATLYEKRGDNGGGAGAVLGTYEADIDTSKVTQQIEIPSFGTNTLTAGRYFDVAVKHVSDGLIIEDEGVIYWESNPVYVDVAGSRVASSPYATVTFQRMPALQVVSKLLDESGNPTSTAPAKSYYVLSEATVGGEQFYALTPLVTSGAGERDSQYNSSTPAVINSYVTRDAAHKRVVYRGNESMTHYIIEAAPGLKIEDLKEDGSNFTAYNSGQLTSEGYLATVSMSGTTTTATLKKMPASAGSDISVTVKLYDSDGKTVAKADPQIGQDLYMLVTLKPKGDSSGNPLAWSVTKLSDARSQLNASGTTTFTIGKQFNLAGSDMEASGQTINFDPNLYDFTLRLYRKTGSVEPDTYNKIRNTANAVDTIQGYDFVGTTKSSDNTSAVLELHKTFPKSYKVRFNINPAGLTVKESDHYYLFIEGKHGDQTSYFLLPLEFNPSENMQDVMVQYIDPSGRVVSGWQDGNGNTTPNVSIDGTWKVTPYLLKANSAINMNSAIAGTNSVRLTNGQNINDYGIQIMPSTYTEANGNRRDYTSVINLGKLNVETPAKTPTDILGNAAEFGVIAGRYVQVNHTETNFAVKTFNHNANIDIDGSGENAIPFVVGKIDEGTRLELTSGMHVDADVYVGETPAQVYDNTAGSKYNVKVTVYPTDKSALDAQVQSYIDAGRAMSASMASKSTVTPQTTNSQFTLDTTGFPDNSTIYVNADGIMAAISRDGGLRINKKPGQSIVFNISGSGTAGKPLTIGEFYVNPNDPDFASKYPGVSEWVQSTTAALDGNPVRNKAVDDVIFEHITFNVTNARYVHLNNTAGLFLLANADQVTQTNGSGWVFAGGSDGQGGLVHSESEWHFYRHYRRYKARGAFTLRAYKKLVDAKGTEVAYENKNFKFELYRGNDSGNYPTAPDETAFADGNGTLYFSTINFTQVDIPFASDTDLTATKSFNFKIVEVIPDDAVNNAGKRYADCSDSEKTSGTFTLDGIVYSAEPVMLRVDATNTRESATATQGKITAEVYLLNESKFATKDDSGEVTLYDIGNITNKRSNVVKGFYGQKNGDYPWESGETFQFTLTGVSAKDKNGYTLGTVPMPEGSTNGAKTVTASQSDPKPYFGDITYTEPGTYTYEMTEVIPTDATATIDGTEYTFAEARAEDSGISVAKIAAATWKRGTVSYDATVHTITVTVADGDPMTATVADNGADITSGATVTFNNKKDQTGSLKLRKQVTVNGAGTTTDFVDAIYAFRIEDEDGNTRSVNITITNGKATAALVDGEPATLDASGFVEVSGLKAGEYTVSEDVSGLAGTGIELIGDNPKTFTVVEGKSGDATPASAQGTFVNNLPTGGLKVQKVVSENGKTISGGAMTVAKGDYVFTVYTDEALTKPLKDASGKDVTVTITLDGTVSSVMSEEITGLKPGDYWVAETSVPSNGTVAVDSPKKVTVEAGKTGETAVIASITNNLTTGGLKVTKTVKSDVSADHSKKFAFKVELSDTTINGTFGGMTFVNGVSEFGLADTESLTATGLPEGVTYTVTETLEAADQSLFTTSWTGKTSAKIEANKVAEVTAANTRHTGDIELDKTLLSDNLPVDKDVEFEFQVKFEEPISGTYGDVTFLNGVATVKIKATGTTTVSGRDAGLGKVTITGLPVDKSYVITEKKATGFELTGVTVPNGTGNIATLSATGKVSMTPSVVNFTNRRLPGGLDVNKTVRSKTSADLQKDFTFRVKLFTDAGLTKPATTFSGDEGVNGAYGVTFDKGVATFTLKHNQTKEIRNLPLGIFYLVEEDTVEGFITTKTGETGVVTAANPVAKFFNDKNEGGLTVFKRVISPLPADHDPSKTFDVTVTLDDTSINETYDDMTFVNGVAHLTLHDGQLAQATGLAKGLKYTVEETLSAADGQLFTVSYQGRTGTIGDQTVAAGVVNTHNPGKLVVKKVVESNQDSDKTREFPFTVTLYRDAACTVVEDTISGTFGEMVFDKGVATFSLKHNATKTADNLPVGTYYTVNENTPTGYTAQVTEGEASGQITSAKAVTWTNKRIYSGAKVEKIWVDEGNRDGIRPTEILVDLQANGRSVSTIKLNQANNWKYEFPQILPAYDDSGAKLVYTWVENNVPTGYTLTTANTENGTAALGWVYGTTLTNTHEIEKTQKTVKKVWDDNSNQDGVITTQTTLVVKLNADGKPALDADGNEISVTLSEDNNWEASVTGLDKYAAGKVGSLITYTWSEGTLPPGYALTSTNTVGDTTTLTNSYKPRETEASIEKVWDDRNDQDDVRPDDITMTLIKVVDGKETELQDVVLSEDNAWKQTVKPLPMFENGKLITYKWSEKDVPPGYTLSGNVTSGTLTTITNKHIPIPTEMEVYKVWRDGEDRDQMRPKFITVSLMRVDVDGTLLDTGIKATLNEGNNWHAKVTGLDKFDHGKLITYIWVEPDIEGYSLIMTYNTGTLQTLTNVHVVKTTTATVKKIWTGEGIDDINKAKIPESLQVALVADGTLARDDNGAPITVTLNASNNWEATVTGLYQNAKGKAIKYEWQEMDLPDGFMLVSNETVGTITSITNKLQTGDLELSKKVVSDVPADKTATYTFTVTLSDTSINGTYGDATFTNGVATVPVVGEGAATITDLPVNVKYSITEAAVANMTTEVINATGTISADKTSVTEGTITEEASKAVFQNSRDKGNLKVSKVLISDAAADKTADFTFTVKLSEPVSGTFSNIEFANGEATFTLKGGQSKLIEGLPAGATFVVTEASTPGFVTGLTDKGEGTITANTTVEIEARNERDKGGLTLSKKLISDRAADADQLFTFTIVLSDKTISNTYDGVSFNRGRATVQLKGSESKTITGLPTGVTYTITEAAATGFELTGIVVNSADQTAAGQATGAITTTASTVEFTNKREPGDLLVTKYVMGSTLSDFEREFEFTVTLTGLSEEAANKTYEGELITLNNDQTVKSRTSRSVTFSNGVATFKLTDHQTQTITGLPTDITYKVEEEDVTADGFALPTLTDCEGTITTNPANASILNAKVEGALLVYKQVDPTVASDLNKTFDFTIRLHNADGTVNTNVNQAYSGVTFTNGVAHVSVKAGKSVSIEGLTWGTRYTVTEDLSADDAKLYNVTWGGDTATVDSTTGAISDSGDLVAATGTIAQHGVAAAGAKNERKPGKLILTKEVVSDLDADKNDVYTFKVELLNEDGSVATNINGTYGDMVFKNGVANVDIAIVNGVSDTATADKLPMGIGYRVSEVTNEEGVTVSIKDATGTVSADPVLVTGTIAGEEKATFVNTREVGGFDVYKWVRSATASDHTKKFKFIVTLADDTINGTSGEQGDYGVEFVDGVATFELTDLETKEIRNLPLGLEYTVEEEEANGFRTSISTYGYYVPINTVTSTVTASALISVMNLRQEGGLTISKVLRSDVASDENKTFTFKVEMFTDRTLQTIDTSVSGEYTASILVNGVRYPAKAVFTDGVSGDIQIPSNASFTMEGLPAGSFYRVTETLSAEDGAIFTTSWESEIVADEYAAGTVATTTNAGVRAYNTHKPGELDVTKLVESNQVSDTTKPFNFRVTLFEGDALAEDGSNVLTSVNGTEGVNGAYGVEFKNGVAEFTLVKDQTIKIGNLPVGVGYLVEEYGANGSADALKAFEVGKTGETGKIAAETVAVAEFTNKRTSTNASVKKVWDDNDDIDGIRPPELYVGLTMSVNNGAPTTVSVATLNEANNWTVAYQGLPKFDDAGNEITYKWIENEPQGYTLRGNVTEGTITTLTNSHIPETTDKAVRKIWNDANNQDGERPPEIVVNLFADKIDTGLTVTLNDANAWGTDENNPVMLKDLPKYRTHGQLINYTWSEQDLPASYALTGTTVTKVDNVDTTTLTNSHNPDETETSVEKVWDDANDQDGKRPDHIVVKLSKTVGNTTELVNGTYEVNGASAAINRGEVTLNEANGWAATVKGLPFKENGQVISYTWEEVAVATYTFDVNKDVVVRGTLTTFTNHYKPQPVSAKIVKKWDDANNQDAIRPNTIEVDFWKHVEGKADEKLGTVTLNVTHATAGNPNEWTYAIDNLPMYEDHGKQITYYWSEVGTPKDYTVTPNTADPSNAVLSANAYVTTITNTHKPYRTDATIKKVWAGAAIDGANKSKIPASLTVRLQADGGQALDIDGNAIDDVILTANNSWTATVDNLPLRKAGKDIVYTWKELDLPADFVLTGTSKNGTITTITNTLQTGNLVISKKVVSNVAADNDAEYTFTVELSDKTISGAHGAATFDAGKATVTVKGNNEALIADLPAGVEYTITEAAVDNMTTQITSADGTITANATVAPTAAIVAHKTGTVLFENMREKGNLKVSKALVSDAAADKNRDYVFEIALEDTNFSGTFSGVAFTGGKGTVTLRAGRDKLIEGLPAGMKYTVTETTTVNGVAIGYTDNHEGTIVAGSTIDVTVTNTRAKGGFTISKALVSKLAADADQQFTFTIVLSDRTITGTYGEVAFNRGRATVQLKGGEKATVSGLPTGVTYTITEASATGFQLNGITVDGTKADAAEGTISTTSPAYVFTNERIPGELNVAKFVRSATTSDHTRTYQITVTLNGLTNEAANATYEGELMQVKLDGTVGSRTPNTVKFTDGVAVLNLTDEQGQKISGLPTGATYSVTEEDVTKQGFTAPAMTNTTGTITETPINAVILNTKTQGGLAVYKQVDSVVPADMTKSFDFVVRLYGDDDKVDTSINQTYGDVEFTNGEARFSLIAGASRYIDNLPLGKKYTVAELLSEADAQLYTLNWTGTTTKMDSVTGDITADGDALVATGTVAGNTVAMAGAKNSRNPGKLTITKKVVSDANDDKNDTYTFKVELLKADGTVDTGITGTFGDMVFSKGVANVAIKIANGATTSATATKLPLGIGYRVTEVEVEDGITVAISDATGTVSTDGSTVEGTVSADEKATFTNTREVGGFDVKKVVETQTTSDRTKDFTFAVTLSDATISGAKGAQGDFGVTFDKGVASFTLKHDEVKHITNLPVGIDYVVEEATEDGFVTVASGTTGVVDNTTPVAEFTNTRDKGGLKVTKIVESDDAADNNTAFTFTVKLVDDEGAQLTNVAGTYGTFNGQDIAFADGSETFALKNGETWEATGLPAGTKYEVTEAANDLFATTSVNETGTIEKDTVQAYADVQFTNTHKPGELDVTKLVESNQSDDSTKPFNFRVTLYTGDDPANVLTSVDGDEGANGAYGVTFAKGIAEFTLVKDQTLKITNLPVGAKYLVEEYAADGKADALKAYTTVKTGETGTIDATTVAKAQFTNTRTETEASVLKVWDDANDQDGKRPITLHVNLTVSMNGAEPVEVSTVTLNEDNGWTATIDKLPTHDDDGNELTYGWSETVPDEYTLSGPVTEGKLTTLTNKYVPRTTMSGISKTWKDNDNQDGVRPASLDVYLYGNDKLVKTVTLDESNHWSAWANDLPMYENGKEIRYHWTEDEDAVKAAGYALTGMTPAVAVGMDEQGRTFTVETYSMINTYKPKETEASIQKVWDDANDQDGVRPDELIVTLNKTVDGKTTEVGKVQLNADNKWAATITGLPMFEGGKAITYSWDETNVPAEYTFNKADDLIVSGTLTTITNHHTPKLTKASVLKVWDDASNQDGMRPRMLTVALMKRVEGETVAREVQRVTLNVTHAGADANQWSYEVEDLPAFQDGKKIAYSWVEWDLPVGYTLVSESTDESADGFVTTITNKHVPEKVKVTVNKVWNDSDDQDGIRPESLTVTLRANDEATSNTATLNEGNGWSATVENLDKYANGRPIEYSWSEDDLPEGYELTNTKVETAADAIIISLTNSHVPAETQVSLFKVWDDADNKEGKRPESLAVDLLADGEVIQSFSLAEDNNWSVFVTGLPKFKVVRDAEGAITDTGVQIAYTWQEDEKALAELGYVLSNTTTETERVLVLDFEKTTFTNTHETGSIKVTKHFAGIDASTLTDAQKAAFSFTVTGPNDFTATNTLDKFVVDEETGDATWTITSLPAGTYKVVETAGDAAKVENYTLTTTYSVEGGEVTIAKNGDAEVTVTNTYDRNPVKATVTKVWDDMDNKFKRRPVELTVSLMQTVNGETTKVQDVTLNEAGKWTATVENLPYFDADGNVISYAWAEDSVPEQYVLVSNQTETAADGSITATLTNHELIGKLRVVKTVHSPNQKLTDEQKAMITFEIKDPEGNLLPGKILSLMDFTEVSSVEEAAPSNALAYQSDDLTAAADKTYIATQYEWVTDWMPLTGVAELDTYHVKETNSMYQWIDERTYRVDDGETVTTPDGVDAPLYDMHQTDVWISDTLLPPDLVISKELVAKSTEGAKAEFTFDIVLTVEENEELVAYRNQTWKDATFEGTLTAADGTESDYPVTFTDGKATIKLKGGEKLAISYLPIGVTYIVTEQETEGFMLTGITGTSTADVATATASGIISAEHIDDHTAIFTNEEKVLETTAELKVTKKVAGDEYKGTENFTFTLAKAEGSTATTDVLPTKLTATAKAGETATFDAISYTEAGTYYYTITEKAGRTANMTYDTTPKWAKVVVAEVEGKLVATVTYGASAEAATAEALAVVNTLVPPSTVVLKATKKLSGRTLAANEFSFQLKDASGKVLQTKRNDASGNITFDAISYTKDDVDKTFEYTIAEVKGSAANMTYDTHTAKVSVKVTMTDGKLVATATYDTSAPATFNNTYTPPSTTPKTGDVTNLTTILALAGTGALSVIAGALRRRRRREDEE